MKFYTLEPLSDSCGATVRAVAHELDQKMEVWCVDEKGDEAFFNSEEYKKMNTTKTFPILETEEVCLQEPSAIIKYLCSLNKKLLGSSKFERAVVEQWLAYVETNMRGTINKVNTGILGTGEIDDSAW